MAEVAVGGIFVDAQHLDLGYLGIVNPVFGCDVVGEAAVVGAAGKDPCCRSYLEVGHRNPQGIGYGELRQWLRLDALHIVHQQTEAVTHIDDGSGDTLAHLGVEDEAGGIAFAYADAKEVDLQTGFVGSNERTDLQHVRLQDARLLAVEVQRVVLQERTAVGQTLCHEPYRAVEGGTLPVAFGTEAIAFSHQALTGKTRNLVEADEVHVVDIYLTEIVEVGGETFRTLVFQDAADGNLCLGSILHLLPIDLFPTLVDLDGIELLVFLY